MIVVDATNRLGWWRAFRGGAWGSWKQMLGGRIAVPIGIASTGTGKLYAYTARNNNLDLSEAT